MAKKYIVRLTGEERGLLTGLAAAGKAAPYKTKRADMLLKLDANGSNWSDAQVAEAYSCAPRTVFTLRERFVEQGLQAAIERKKRDRPPRAPILDDEKKARLIEIAGGKPPPGHARWTLRLLAEELVARGIVESISAPTIMRVLRKGAAAAPTGPVEWMPPDFHAEGPDRPGGSRGAETNRQPLDGHGATAVGRTSGKRRNQALGGPGKGESFQNPIFSKKLLTPSSQDVE